MSIDRRHLLLAAAGSVSGTAAAQNRTLAALKPGQAAPAFRVRDAAGSERSLNEFAGRTVVLEWTSTSCPFVKAQYASGAMQALQQWSKQRGAVWLSVLSTHPKRSDYLPGAKAQAFHSERAGASTALLMDETGAMGYAYGARTTPHMFIVAPAGTLAYLGAIDDNATVNKATVTKSRNYVKAALEEVFAGKPVSTPATRPYGCSIGYED